MNKEKDKYLGARFLLSYFREFVLIVAGGFMGAIIGSYSSSSLNGTSTFGLILFYGVIFILLLIVLDFIDHFLGRGRKTFKKYYKDPKNI